MTPFRRLNDAYLRAVPMAAIAIFTLMLIMDFLRRIEGDAALVGAIICGALAGLNALCFGALAIAEAWVSFKAARARLS